MGFDQGRLYFDHDNLTYNVGEIVHGKLVFSTDKMKEFRGIYMRMKGYCKVHWTTRHSRRVNDKTEHYTLDHDSHEEYFKHKVYLIGSENGEIHLPPGNHEFPFQCLIPGHCPSSFEGSQGHVRYEVKVVVNRAFKFDQEKEVQLTVVNRKDLNMDPYCKEPMQFAFEETYCCWCMSAGLCEITVRAPQSGYCPGQVVHLDVGCQNNSNVEIDSIAFEIKKYMKFIAAHHPDTRKESFVVAKLKKGPIPGNTTRNWMLEMEIPDMDVYNLDACKYIDIYFKFNVNVSTSGCHSDSDDSRAIIIGHIPLREGDTLPDQMVSQPVAPNMSGYPGQNPFGMNPVYPQNQYPGQNLPMVSPVPGPSPPYPGPNPAFPAPYPSFPGANPPYPGQNIPMVNPVPGPNPPYPAGNLPYPPADPSNLPPNPYPTNPGFMVPQNDSKHNMNMPYPSNVPPANPFASASAPEPNTPN